MDTTPRMSAAEYRQLQTPECAQPNTEQAYRNRVSNDRGRSFENLLMKGCQYYHSQGVAVINKVHEPYIVTKQLPDGRFAGRHCGKAEPDFKGVLSGGRAIAFEAKSTQKTRIQYSAVTPTQLRWLQEQAKLGALAFVAVNIKEHFYSIPLYRWEKMKELYGKKFLMHGDIEQYEVKFDGAVRFLEYEGGGWLPNEEDFDMRKSKLVSWATEIIKRYYEAEKELILSDPNCCHSDTLQALTDECYALFNGFMELLE